MSWTIAPAGQQPETRWKCGVCAFLNGASYHSCQRCRQPKGFQPPELPGAGASEPERATAAETPGGTPHAIHPGGWDCPYCRNHNYANRTVCNRCGIDKGGQATDAETKQQSASAEWLCPGCGNHNWAIAQECNRCSQPKPPPERKREARVAPPEPPPATVYPPDPPQRRAESPQRQDDDFDDVVLSDSSSEAPRKRRRLVPKIKPGWRQLDLFNDDAPVAQKVSPRKKHPKKSKSKKEKPAPREDPSDPFVFLRRQAQELDGLLQGQQMQVQEVERKMRRKEAQALVNKDREEVATQLQRRVVVPTLPGDTWRKKREREWNEAEKLLERLDLEAKRQRAMAARKPQKRSRAEMAPAAGNDEDSDDGGVRSLPAAAAAGAAALQRQRLSAAEAAAALAEQRDQRRRQEQAAAPGVDGVAAEIILLFDKDRDGALCYSEFAQMCKALTGATDARQAKVPPPSRFAAEYGDGVSRVALLAMLKKQPPQRLQQTVSMLQRYKDGGSGAGPADPDEKD